MDNTKKLMYRGDKERGTEIIENLIALGGNPCNLYTTNTLSFGQMVDDLYFIDDLGYIDYLDADRYGHILSSHFELTELPPKLELIPGEMYMCRQRGLYMPFILDRLRSDGVTVDAFCGINNNNYFVRGCQAWCAKSQVMPINKAQKAILEMKMKENCLYFDKDLLKLIECKLFCLIKEHGVLIRTHNDSPWFHYYPNHSEELTYFRLNNQVIPYNDETKELVGMPNHPNTHYILIGDNFDKTK